MTRHSREDALTNREFELLLEGAMELPEPQDREARLIILLGGRLGLRPGETAHLRSEWVDTRAGMITIPRHDPCTFGRNGEICGYCENQARREHERYNYEVSEVLDAIEQSLLDPNATDSDLFDTFVSFVADKEGNTPIQTLNRIQDRYVDGDTLDRDAATELAVAYVTHHNKPLEEFLENRWHPKTPNSARTIPFDFDTRTEIALERFVDRYDQFPKSRAVVNRRVTDACEAADEPIDVYPHALRATSATYHAARGISVYTLQNLMGWKKIATAEKYIRSSGEATAMELRAPK
ncbi:tyrosine-type recombinase/integrase (plasmid) [Natrialbaceae archaeon A-CW2]